LEPDVKGEWVSKIDEVIKHIAQGWGVITAGALNTELAEDPDLILIDVRRAEELTENGVIDSSGNLLPFPLEEFVAMRENWPADKEANIVVYCDSGHRSTIAMSVLDSYGYSNVRSLKGGFSGWAESGYPVVEYATP
jgi:rhodanese-related sulfurtransferase